MEKKEIDGIFKKKLTKSKIVLEPNPIFTY